MPGIRNCCCSEATCDNPCLETGCCFSENSTMSIPQPAITEDCSGFKEAVEGFNWSALPMSANCGRYFDEATVDGSHYILEAMWVSPGEWQIFTGLNSKLSGFWANNKTSAGGDCCGGTITTWVNDGVPCTLTGGLGDFNVDNNPCCNCDGSCQGGVDTDCDGSCDCVYADRPSSMVVDLSGFSSGDFGGFVDAGVCSGSSVTETTLTQTVGTDCDSMVFDDTFVLVDGFCVEQIDISWDGSKFVLTLADTLGDVIYTAKLCKYLGTYAKVSGNGPATVEVT